MLTVLAALPYQLGDVATIVPPAWKSKIVTAGIVATFILRVLNGLQQKDKNVTGGTLQQTADGQVADPALLGGVSKSVADTQKAIPKA